MEDNTSKKTPSKGEVPLLHYLILIAWHGKMIFYATVAATLITYLVLFILPNKYTASALISPPKPNLTLSGKLMEYLGGGSVSSEGGISGFGNLGSWLGIKEPADIYVGMLTSKTVFDHIITRFKLKDVYDKTYIEETRAKLGKRAKIEVEKSGLISIKVTDESPQRATQMANAFVEELDALLQRMNRTEANDNLAFLEKERERSLVSLSKAEEDLRAFSEKQNVLQIDAQTKGVLEYIATLRASIDAKEVQMEVLRQRATPLNPELINLATEIKGLKEKLKDAEAKEPKNFYGQAILSTSKVPLLGLEYLRLFRETKFQEGIYDLYCKLVELAHLDKTRTVNAVQVVDYAVQPERRSNMRLLPSVLVGLGTFVFAIFFALFWEHFKSIKNEESVRQITILKEITQPWLKIPKHFLAFFKRSNH